MSESRRLDQSGGDNSVNIQGNNVTIHNGITYSEAKEIALDVFTKNFLSLSQQAAETAKRRAEELVVGFLTKLEQEKAESISHIVDPGVQYALYTAQKEFARTGDKNISNIFVDILVDRISLIERDIKQIVFDESLLILPKLTIPQLDTMTIIFLLKYAPKSGDFDLNFSLAEEFKPFSDNLQCDTSLINHLIYSDCTVLSTSGPSVETLFLLNFKCLISKGLSEYSRDKLFEKISDSEWLRDYLIPSPFNDPKEPRKTLAFFNKDDMLIKLKEKGVPQNDIDLCVKGLESSYHIDYTAITKYLTTQEFMKKIVDSWNNSDLQYLELTDVGKVIANANYRRKTGKKIRLDIGR